MERIRSWCSKGRRGALTAGLEASKKWIRQAIELQEALIEKVGAPEKMAFETMGDYSDEVFDAVNTFAADKIAVVQQIADKMERQAAEAALKDETREALAAQFPDAGGEIGQAIPSITKSIVRKRIVDEGLRIDGRRPTSSARSRPTSILSRPLTERACSSVATRRSQLHDARDGPHGPDDRWHRPDPSQAVHAPLQLPAVLHW